MSKIRESVYGKLFLKTALLLTCATLIGTEIMFAQDRPLVNFGNVSLSDFDLPKSKVVDSNSNAVIIAKVGSLEFIGNDYNWVSYVYKRNFRIKILNQKGYDLATVKIQLFGQDNRQDKMDDFHASTYNVENGKVVQATLTNSDVFSEKISKNVNEKKFTMPDVREGSIIEYSYTITSYHYYYLPEWSFQNLDYPCLYSEFKIAIPDLLRYVTIRYGVDSFYSFKSDEGHKTLVMANVNVSSTIHNHTWIMKDIAPFKSEDYIYEPQNYLDKLEFSLVQTSNGRDVSDVRTWKTEEDQLLKSRAFGAAIDVDNATNLYNTMKRVCSLDGDITEAAKHIYDYVRDNFICIPDDDILVNDLYEINKLHKGSVAELNMLLIALLRQRGIKADPLILTTKNFGNHPEDYPILEKMNYVICLMRVGRDSIYLDASDPLLGFGRLPLACYNGHAQIIDEGHSGPLYFYPNSIKEQNKTFITIVNDENGNGASGSFESVPGYFESYDLRNDIKETGQDAYLKKIRLYYGSDVEIKNLQIDSLKQLEQPVKINYDINFTASNVDDVIYFNPFISDEFKENPFKSTERKYPVEMPYPLDDTYELTMDIPKGYKVDELPKSVKVSFNGTDGFFEYTIQKDESLVQLRSHVKLNQAIFAPEDYNSLRDFFSYVVKKQSEQIVFKKK